MIIRELPCHSIGHCTSHIVLTVLTLNAQQTVREIVISVPVQVEWCVYRVKNFNAIPAFHTITSTIHFAVVEVVVIEPSYLIICEEIRCIRINIHFL